MEAIPPSFYKSLPYFILRSILRPNKLSTVKCRTFQSCQFFMAPHTSGRFHRRAHVKASSYTRARQYSFFSAPCHGFPVWDLLRKRSKEGQIPMTGMLEVVQLFNCVDPPTKPIGVQHDRWSVSKAQPQGCPSRSPRFHLLQPHHRHRMGKASVPPLWTTHHNQLNRSVIAWSRGYEWLSGAFKLLQAGSLASSMARMTGSREGCAHEWTKEQGLWIERRCGCGVHPHQNVH